jgi:hypothetical protein
MDLEALRAQARAVATRMETRLSTALTENRELTSEEETANQADEAELADLKSKIAAAEASSGTPADSSDPVAAAVAAERTRILALADLCPSSVIATPLRTAIDSGQDAGAFAIGIATAAKQRGASMTDLRRGAVQADQLPQGGAPADPKGKTDADKAKGMLALAANAGVAAAAHLKPKS